MHVISDFFLSRARWVRVRGGLAGLAGLVGLVGSGRETDGERTRLVYSEGSPVRSSLFARRPGWMNVGQYRAAG